MHFPVELLILLCDMAEASESVGEIITKEANSKLFCCFQVILFVLKIFEKLQLSLILTFHTIMRKRIWRSLY